MNRITSRRDLLIGAGLGAGTLALGALAPGHAFASQTAANYIDPLAPKYEEWKARAAKIQIAETPRADTLPFGADRLGRDVLDKAIKGGEVSIFVGLFAALLATVIGTPKMPSVVK